MKWLRSRESWEKEENERLAPYAVRSAESLGRNHPEPEHRYRTVFQRDRDRIVHSRAFRRLEYKTQVFVYHEGDHYRNRLPTPSRMPRSPARSLVRSASTKTSPRQSRSPTTWATRPSPMRASGCSTF